MTAVLAAATRIVLLAALLLITLASLLWTAFGPQGAWALAWTGVVFVVVSCAVPAWIALQPKGDGDA
jgi:uncharacterized membrane protein YqjE